MTSAFALAWILTSQSTFAWMYGSDSADYTGYPSSLIRTSDGGYAFTGYTKATGYEDIIAVRLSPAGDVLWAKRFSPTVNDRGDRGYSIAQTSDGGFVIAGFTLSFNSYDIMLLRLNSSGGLLWAKTYGGAQPEEAYSVIRTAEGGFALGGFMVSAAGNPEDFCALKLNADGSLVWAKTFGGTGSEKGRAIAQTSDGGFVLVGETKSYGSVSSYEILVLKMRSDGSREWAEAFGSTVASFPDYAYSVGCVGDTVFVGAYTLASAGNNDFLVLKLNPDGTRNWAKLAGGSVGGRQDLLWSMAPTSDRGLVCVGQTTSYGAGSDDFFVVRLSPEGNMVWARTCGGLGSDIAYSVVQTSDGGYAIFGQTQSAGAAKGDLLLLKLDPSGNHSYGACVPACYPDLAVPTINTTPVTDNTNPWTPTVTDRTASMTVSDLPLHRANFCEALYEGVEEGYNPSQHWITATALPGGLLFVSHEDADIRVYSGDGRLVCSERLIRGKSWFPLGQGVYFWIAGGQGFKGKAVVR